MKTLSNILNRVGTTFLSGNTDIGVNKICFNSNEVGQYCVFVAIKGWKQNGHDFIEQAIENGAIAIVCEDIPKQTKSEIIYVKVNDSANALGIMASNFFDNPSAKLKLIGVTGTNGKTTIVTLLYELFIKLGYKVGLISTIQNKINDKTIESTHTTPNPVNLNALLNSMQSEGCTYCFMEVSSHAIVQSRISGLTFAGGVFTNLSHEHLDYHKTFRNYLNAKKLFFDYLHRSAFSLTNIDDKNGLVMLQNTKSLKSTYGLSGLADFRCRVLENSFEGLTLSIENFDVHCQLLGKFNAYNVLAVYATAMLLKQESSEEILAIITTFKPVEGRFDVNLDKIISIIDYAHTPDALEKVLKTINAIRTRNEKLITVVGAGGNRDKEKRPIMAKIACKHSNQVILTSDNPRYENAKEIINDMKNGIDVVDASKVISIVDREEAIHTACSLANDGDIILIAGKGHEKYQEINGTRIQFDDKEILKKYLN